MNGKCEGSELGSQVYSRSALYEGKWAIMYASYFPKDVTEALPGLLAPFFRAGVRHLWLHAVVWIDDVALDSPSVLAISTQEGIEKPVDRAHINDTTAKLSASENFESETSTFHNVGPATESGEFQDLIQWEQMTQEARDALDVADFGEDNPVPFIDDYFNSNIKAAATSYTYEYIAKHRYNKIAHDFWGEGNSSSASTDSA